MAVAGSAFGWAEDAPGRLGVLIVGSRSIRTKGQSSTRLLLGDEVFVATDVCSLVVFPRDILFLFQDIDGFFRPLVVGLLLFIQGTDGCLEVA